MMYLNNQKWVKSRSIKTENTDKTENNEKMQKYQNMKDK